MNFIFNLIFYFLNIFSPHLFTDCYSHIFYTSDGFGNMHMYLCNAQTWTSILVVVGLFIKTCVSLWNIEKTLFKAPTYSTHTNSLKPLRGISVYVSICIYIVDSGMVHITKDTRVSTHNSWREFFVDFSVQWSVLLFWVHHGPLTH